jgi:CDP-diglyceride synthetase
MQDIRYNQAMRRPLPLAARRDTGGKDSPFIHMHLLYRVGIVVLYIVVLLTIVVNLEVSSKSPAFTFLCLALVVNFAVVLLPVAFYKPHYGWFHPLVYLSIGYLAFHARSFATYLNGIGQHRALPTWSADDITMLIAYALALGALGNVAYFFGFFLGPEFRVPKIRFSHTSRFSVKAVVIVACTMVVFLLYMRSEGGLTAHLMSWQSGRHETMKGRRLLASGDQVRGRRLHPLVGHQAQGYLSAPLLGLRRAFRDDELSRHRLARRGRLLLRHRDADVDAPGEESSPHARHHDRAFRRYAGRLAGELQRADLEGEHRLDDEQKRRLHPRTF